MTEIIGAFLQFFVANTPKKKKEGKYMTYTYTTLRTPGAVKITAGFEVLTAVAVKNGYLLGYRESLAE
jgi:hypothetical protein